jgi:hypothetical protein
MKRAAYFTFLISILFITACQKSNDDPVLGSCRMLQSSGFLCSPDKCLCYYDENHKIIKMEYIGSNDTSWDNYYYENGHVVYMNSYFGTY